MKLRLSLVILIIALIVIFGSGYKGLPAAEFQQLVAVDIEKIQITVVYDNNPGNKGLEPDWGFSCIIWGLDRTILFDTGQQPSILISNMAKLGINPKQVEVIVLSHEHYDHIGGLAGLLDANPDVSVYLLKSFSPRLKEMARNYGAQVIEVNDPLAVSKNTLSTGELRSSIINEQALLVLTDKGLIIITGCAHPGVVNIVGRAKKLTKQQVLLLLGGFHLLNCDDANIRNIISRLKELGVRYVAPGHCSGLKAQKLFAEEYGENFLDCVVGRTIFLKDLSS
jgi:7,8-dihydropterin-6-yl-methyl-4-(beta-D-ribofuranosyl)aminobenzene 5'-phosphate synthase